MQSLVEPLKTRHAARGKARSILALLLVVVGGTTGCGNSLYALRANAAAIKLEEARSAGAQQLAPYEYTLAEEHLNKSMSEAAEADYGDAFNLANAAYEYADQAVQRCEQNLVAQPTNDQSAKEPAE
jgi:hypothetical protein